ARRAPRAIAIIALPEVEILDGVALDVLDLLRPHLPHGLGRHAHHEPARRHDFALRHERAGRDLRAVLGDGARQHDGTDADANVVADPAGVHHAAMTDGDAIADDAWKLGRHVEHRVVLHIRVPADVHVVVLIAAHHGERPDRGALLDDDIA